MLCCAVLCCAVLCLLKCTTPLLKVLQWCGSTQIVHVAITSVSYMQQPLELCVCTDTLFASVHRCCTLGISAQVQQCFGSNTSYMQQPLELCICTDGYAVWVSGLRVEQHNRLCVRMHPVQSLLALLCTAAALLLTKQRHTSMSCIHWHIQLRIDLHMVLYIRSALLCYDSLSLWRW